MPAVLRRAVPALAVTLLSLALMTACAPQEATIDPDAGPSPTGEASGDPTPTATAQPTGTPIDAACDDLVTPAILDLYGPGFAGIDGFTPREGSAAASALAYDGVACRWQSSSGQTIDISAAQLDDASLTALKNAAFEDSELVPTYGDEAYFTVEGGVGVAQVFQGPYWIVVESPVFFEPGDATEIVQSIISGLGA